MFGKYYISGHTIHGRERYSDMLEVQDYSFPGLDYMQAMTSLGIEPDSLMHGAISYVVRERAGGLYAATPGTLVDSISPKRYCRLFL